MTGALGKRLVEEIHKVDFYGFKSDAYQIMVPTCIRLGNKSEALEYAERSKSRAFLDVLATTYLTTTVKMTIELEALINQEGNCLMRLRQIQNRSLLNDTVTTVKLGEVIVS